MASTYTAERAAESNRPFYFVHLEGLPYLWFTTIPPGWSVPSGWDYRAGLSIDDTTIEQSVDPLAGIADADTLTIKIFDTLLETLFATQRQTSANSSELHGDVNNVTAGADVNLKTVAALSDAPTGAGTVYVGNQTVTYTSRSGVDFSGCIRGRYAILGAGLAEEEWKPRIAWDANLGVAPLVTLYPRTVRGRMLTLYRCYYDVNGTELVKAQATVRWRGRVEAYGMTDDTLGFELQAVSLLDMLDQHVMADGVAEYDLKGYSLQAISWNADPASSAWKYIHLRESKWYLYGTDATAWKVKGETAVDRHISIGDVSYYETPEALIKAINDALKAAWNASPKQTFAPWFCRRGKGGKIEIGYDCVGYDGTSLIAKGAASGTFDHGVYGEIYADELAAALGHGDADRKRLPVTSMSGTAYRHNFAKWTNPTYFSSMLIANLGYSAASRLADSEAAAAWIALEKTLRIPVDLPSGYPSGCAAYQESLADGSPFLVRVGDQIIYRCNTVDTVSSDIYLTDAGADYRSPIATQEKPDESFLAVSESEAAAGQAATARQVFAPACAHRTQIGTSGMYLTMTGVQYMLLQLMLSAGDATNYNGEFDELPGGWGLAIPEQYVDTDSWLKLGGAFANAALQRQWLLDEPTSFREILEAEAKTLGFWVTQRGGRITAVPVSVPTAVNVRLEITDDLRLVDGERHWQSSPEGVINELVLKADYDWKAGDLRTTEQHSDLAAQMDSGAIQSLEIENRGIRTEYFGGNSDDTIDEVDQIMADRLAHLAAERYTYECEVNRSADEVAIGDAVSITDARIPNPIIGGRGIADFLGLVIEATAEEATGRGRLTVLLSTQSIQKPASMSVAGAKPKAGAAAPSFKVDKIWGDTIYGEAFAPTDDAQTWSIGDKVRVWDLETGSAKDASVLDWNPDTGALKLDQPVEIAFDPAQTVVTYQPFAAQSPGSEALAAGYIAGSAGNMSTGILGYKLG